jgi:hypothetical protein
MPSITSLAIVNYDIDGHVSYQISLKVADETIQSTEAISVIGRLAQDRQ